METALTIYSPGIHLMQLRENIKSLRQSNDYQVYYLTEKGYSYMKHFLTVGSIQFHKLLTIKV